MPSTKQLLVPPAGLLAAFVLWRSLRRTPLSKVASSAQIGKLRSASQHNLVDAGSKASSAQQGNTNGTGNAGGGKKTTCVNATPNARQSQVSFMNTRSLIRLIWQTFNSRHFRGGLRRGVAVAVAFAMLTRWVLRKLGFSQEWSLVRLAITNLAVFWFFYYRRHIVEMPVLHFHRDFYHVSLVLRSKISQTPFRPVPWLVCFLERCLLVCAVSACVCASLYDSWHARDVVWHMAVEKSKPHRIADLTCVGCDDGLCLHPHGLHQRLIATRRQFWALFSMTSTIFEFSKSPSPPDVCCSSLKLMASM